MKSATSRLVHYLAIAAAMDAQSTRYIEEATTYSSKPTIRHKTPLTPKQKKARAKSKRAKSARKHNRNK